MDDGTRGGTAEAVTRLRRGAVGGHLPRFDSEALQLLNMVSRELNLPVEVLLGPSRRATVAHARQLAMYLCYVALGRRQATVGRLFARHPSTVSYACAKIEDMRDDAGFDDRVSRIEEAIAASLQSATQPMERIRAAG